MSKWLFLLKELILYVSFSILAYALLYGILFYLDLGIDIIDKLSLSNVIGAITIPTIFYVYSLIKPLLLDVDFNKEFNQSGALELKFFVEVNKEDLVKALNKRGINYSIQSSTEDKNTSLYEIQDSSNKSDQIRIRFNHLEVHKTEVIIRVQEDETNWALLPMKSKNWRSHSDYLSDFKDLFVDYEVKHIHSRVKALKVTAEL